MAALALRQAAPPHQQASCPPVQRLPPALFRPALHTAVRDGPPKELPDNFYIRNRRTVWYLLYDPYSGSLASCPKEADATVFHVKNTDDSDLSGIPQLSLYHPALSDNEEYGAYVDYEGGPIRLFQAGDVPKDGDWFIVTASFSTYLCQLSLITWNLHDLSTPENCGGYNSLGYWFGEDEFPEVKLIVEPA